MMRYRGANLPPVRLGFIENSVVVLKDENNKRGITSGLSRGDIILSIDSIPVEEIIKERLPYTGASNYPTAMRNLMRSLLRSKDDTIEVDVQRQGTILHYTLPCLTFEDYQKPAPDTFFRFVADGIGCLYPGSLKNSNLPDVYEALTGSKGLIIDFRCYPADFTVFTLSEFLLPYARPFVKFTTGNITHPGLFSFTDPLKIGKSANTKWYRGKVVILVNETTQSSAEYHVMAFRQAPGSVIIGSTTAGADGNVSKFMLPGGIETMITGIGVYWPDGRETQRIGIVPDIVVKPTIKGIIEGRDELMEKAIAVISKP